tara:strand:+ start:263 stop:601 length:339 start_codon:yes stop_codon:yes gene_type:complete
MDPHQDFKEIILRNPSSKKDKIVSSQPSVVISKLQKQLLNDDEEGPNKIKTFGKENGKILQNARTSRKLTQEQLANQINEKKNVINSYEVGNIVPDNKILNKLRRILNIKFN